MKAAGLQILELSHGISIAYESIGSSGPVMVCLHGFGASRETWNDIKPHMSGVARMVMLDLLGFGKSSKPRGADYSPRAQAEIVSESIDKLNHTGVTLVGHSYGGGIALLTYFLRMGRGIERLILIDAAGYEQPLPFFVGVLRIPVINKLILAVIPSRLRATITLRHLFHARAAITQERIERYAKYFDLPGAHAAYIAAAKAVVPNDLDSIVSAIPTITVPTLVIWGTNDAVISVKNARQFATDISGSQIIVMPRCGHIPHEEWPVETAEALRNFINGRR